MAASEVLIEFHQIGHAVKVTAVDPVTLVEVSIVGPAAASQAQLERAVIAKLDYVQNGRRPRGGSPAAIGGNTPARRGVTA